MVTCFFMVSILSYISYLTSVFGWALSHLSVLVSPDHPHRFGQWRCWRWCPRGPQTLQLQGSSSWRGCRTWRQFKEVGGVLVIFAFSVLFFSYFSHLEANWEGSWQPQTSPKTRPMIRMPVLIPLNEGTVMQRLSPLRHILFSVPLDSADWLFSASIRLFFSSAKRTSREFFTSRISWSSILESSSHKEEWAV